MGLPNEFESFSEPEVAKGDEEFVQAVAEAIQALKLPREQRVDLVNWVRSCRSDDGLILRQTVIDALTPKDDPSFPLLVAGAEERLEAVHPGTVGSYLILLGDDEEVAERVEMQDRENEMDPTGALATQGAARILKKKQEEAEARAAEEQLTWPDGV